MFCFIYISICPFQCSSFFRIGPGFHLESSFFLPKNYLKYFFSEADKLSQHSFILKKYFAFIFLKFLFRKNFKLTQFPKVIVLPYTLPPAAAYDYLTIVQGSKNKIT